MSFQDLSNVCSVRHMHHLNAYESSATFLKALQQVTDDRSVILFVGPRQVRIREVLRRAKKRHNEDIRRLYAFDSGHGGETEVWFLINRHFRDGSGSTIADLFKHLKSGDFT